MDLDKELEEAKAMLAELKANERKPYPTDKEGKLFENQDNKGKKKMKKKCKKGGKVNQAIRSW